MEAKRKLVTADKENQVQIDDLAKEYPFVMSLTDHGDMISQLFVEKAAFLRFEK